MKPQSLAAPMRALLLSFMVLIAAPAAFAQCPSHLPPPDTWADLPVQSRRAPPPSLDRTLDEARGAYSEGRFAEALSGFQRALPLARAHFGERHLVTSTIELNTAIAALDAGRPSLARVHAETALAIRRAASGGDSAHTVTIIALLGNIAAREGRGDNAVSYLVEAAAIGEQCLDADDDRLLITYNDLGVAYDGVGALTAAETQYNHSLEGWERRGDIYCTGGARSCGEALGVLRNLSANLSAQGKFREAIATMELILSLYRRQAGPVSEEASRLLVQLGDLEGRANLGLAVSPMFRYEEALAMRRSLGRTDDLFYAATLTRHAEELETQTRVGRDYVEREFLAALRLADAIDPRPEWLRVSILTGLARTALSHAPLRALDRAREAVRWRDPRLTDSGRSIVRRPGGDCANGDLRHQLLARALYASRTNAPFSRTELDEAFSAMQSANRSCTDGALRRGLAAQGPNASPLIAAIVETGARVDAADQAMETLARGENSAERRRETLQARTQAARELDRAMQQLRDNDPRFFDLIEPSTLSLSELEACSGPNRELLRDDEALILISPGAPNLPAGHRRGFVFVAVKQCGANGGLRTAWAELSLEPDALDREIKALRVDLDGAERSRGFSPAPMRARGQGDRPFDRSRSHALYNALFGDPDVAALLASRANWVIAPQGDLVSLPFAALVTMLPPGGSAGDGDPDQLRATTWLGLDRTLSILPAVSSLAALRRDATRLATDSAVTFFGVGDPQFEGAPDGERLPVNTMVRGGFGVRDVRALPRLEGTRVEIEALARLLNADRQNILMGVRANEPSLRAAHDRLARARIVAFATHGLIAGDLTGLAEPALALTPPAGDGGDASDDGLLTASEIALMRLSADWVILSACNTAAGDSSAEGLSGLARAFFYAGARSLLVSQWRVRDDVAAQIVARSVALAGAQPGRRAEALRQAMRELASDRSQDGSGHSFAHPGAWAPFIYVGLD